MPLKIKRFGWIADLPDQRDYIYAAPGQVLASLPPKADLRLQCPPVYDQDQLGSATANAIAAAVEFDLMKQQKQDFIPSRLFIYYNEREIEGTVDSDSGAQIRNGLKSIASQGECPDDEWPYDTSKFAQKPSQKSYDDAIQHKSVLFQRVVRTLNQMKGCLASGYPFVFGFTVYESFESQEVTQSGHVSMPAPGEKVVGGHAVLAVGYDDSQNCFIVRNSWGTGWGMKGYFILPYAYFLDQNLSDDFWSIRVIS
jgi:C1A family cysteine protease